MTDKLIKWLRRGAVTRPEQAQAADLIEQQAARIAELEGDVNALRWELKDARTANGAEPTKPIEFVGIAEMLTKGDGHWHPCSGCYDTEDGHPTQRYAYSASLNCSLGNGCSECGGLGAVWLNYADLPTAEDLAEQEDAAPVADSAVAKDAEMTLNLPPAMTPYGMLVRALRIVAGATLYDMAKHLHCTPAMLSGVEFGRKPLTDAMIADTSAYFSSLGIHDTLHALNAAAIAASAEKVDTDADQA